MTHGAFPWPPATRARASRAVLIFIVAATAFVVHARVLKYPFIQDDWIRIEQVLTPNPLQVLRDEFSPVDKGEYRPFGTLYFFVVARVFNLNPFVTHAISLLLHAAGSLLVAMVLIQITRDPVVGWIGGILYGAASSVHMDPLLWTSGIFDTASVLLALVSLWLFLEGRIWSSALAYAAALLFKESVAFLPAVIWTISMSPRANHSGEPNLSLLANLRKTWLFILILVLYTGIKLVGVSPLSLSQDEPYVIRLTGPHVLRNVLTYSQWSVEALFPSHPISSTAAAGLLVGLAAVLVIGTLVGNPTRRRLDSVLPGAACLFVWLIGSVSVFLFLPNHVYKYYLTVPLPALSGLMILALRGGWDRARLPARMFAPLMALFAVASVVSSFVYFRQIDLRGLNQPNVEGTNDLVRRGATVMAVRDGLLKAHATLPPRALLLFKGVEIWAFGKDSGPIVWYHDPTIRAYDARDLVKESNRWVLRNPPEDQSELYTGAPARRIALECCPVFFFELTERGLVERQLDLIQQ